MRLLRALLLVAVVGVLATRIASAPRVLCPSCNVVLVTFDALRADHLGAYGYPRPTSPVFDRLAEGSVLFLHNMSQSGSTISSVPSLLTGRFPHADRILSGRGLRPGERTLAAVLGEHGYRTLAVIAHEYARCRWGMCQGFAYTDDDYVAPEKAERTMDRVEAALDRRAREPFFLWIHVRQPHSPYDPERADFERFYAPRPGEPTYYDDGDRVRWVGRDPLLLRYYRRRGERPRRYRLERGTRFLTPSMVAQRRALYDGGVREADRALGRLLELLRERGWADRTVLVLAADHGERLGEGRLFGHNDLDSITLHTPLLVHAPGLRPRRVDAPTMNVDIVPTVLAILGMESGERLRGRDAIAPIPADRFQYAEYSKRWVVVQDGFELRRRASGPPELYDLRSDPAGARDLSERAPERVRALRAIRRRIRRESLARDRGAPDVSVLEQLRALGYIRGPGS